MTKNISANATKDFLKKNLVLCGILILAVVTAAVEPKFLGAANLNNVLKQLGALPFAALGMTFVIIAGFIDLSIVGMISLTGVVTISLIDPLGQWGALIAGVLLGALLGYITGAILTGCGAMTQAEVLFITYGMSSVWLAIGLIFTQGVTIKISKCRNPYGVFTALGSKNIGILPVALIVFLIFLVFMNFFHKKTIWGRSISLLGGNKDAAYLAGFNVKRVMRMVYAIEGAMAGLAAIMLMSRVTSANATMGTGYETNAILCVVVGGTTLKGGKGSVVRTMLGVFLITVLGNCMNMLDLSTYMQTVMRGAVLVVAIWLDNRNQQ